MWYQNMRSALVWFACLVLSQSTRVTDGQTDRITTTNNALACVARVARSKRPKSSFKNPPILRKGTPQIFDVCLQIWLTFQHVPALELGGKYEFPI